ncbi:ribonucleotide reductase small subunit [Tupanvirus soda lake]|uniref:Ribonucleoside-diphosphate reductase small chain n=2 Tax=Tupanvirus TaxID=2094720 RepID=A0A6N1NR22_9VIRU|nr:ribonucleotide reductase small subunit [Tupanvirus soda lake]QKU35057.1 ribonucleotide reductase small subunit [Tupanvirus soda lake]
MYNPQDILLECNEPVLEEYLEEEEKEAGQDALPMDFNDFLINEITDDIKFVEDDDEQESEEVTEPYLPSYRKYANDFMSLEIKREPILSTTSERYTVYPIQVQYSAIWKIYKKQLQCNWVVEEVDLSKDVAHWEKLLSINDKKFLMHVLAFFSAADGIVNANIKQNLIDVVKIKEAECAYGKQFEMENAHGEMYSLMLDTFVKDEKLKTKLIQAIKTMPSIKKKAKWCQKWINSDKTYAHKLIAFAIVEGIFFSGSFASIFWLKTRPGSIMPGLRKSNKFIARDENLHVELACALYALLKNRLKESVVYEILEEAIAIEEEFINDSLPCRLLGMNATLMSQYIKYCADRLLVQLGYQKKYNVENPFEYMKKIDTFCKENFFEGRVDAYSDAKINNPRIFIILEDGY